MRLKLVGEAIFQPGRIVGTVAGKSVVLGGRSALSAIAIAENIFFLLSTVLAPCSVSTYCNGRSAPDEEWRLWHNYFST